MGAHAIKDYLEGYPRDECRKFLPELRAGFAREGLDWDREARKAQARFEATNNGKKP
jgi:hypothetical protein